MAALSSPQPSIGDSPFTALSNKEPWTWLPFGYLEEVPEVPRFSTYNGTPGNPTKPKELWALTPSEQLWLLRYTQVLSGNGLHGGGICGYTTGCVQSGLGWTAEQLQYLFARTRGGWMQDATVQ